MTKLFDKITGTSDSYDANSITDSTANWVINKYQGWYCVVAGNEYLIASNTATSLVFVNTFVANVNYSIEFVGRSFLSELESDASNTTKIPDALVLKKYNQVNSNLSNKTFAYLRGLYKNDFDPLANILNIICLQQVFAYLLLAKIYQDLSIDQDSFESFKGYNMFEKSYNDGIKDSLALLRIDFDEDGVANVDEIKNSASTFSFLNR